MSLDKAIKYGKEHRKSYYGAKAIDATCRPNGGCTYCAEGRLRSYKLALLQEEDDYENLPAKYVFSRRHVNRQRSSRY